MSLKEALASANKENRTKIPAEVLAVMDGVTDTLVSEKLAEKAVKTGDMFPEATLPNAKGEQVSIKEHLQAGPVVVSFYRGGWCPYCNIELKALEDALPQITEKGASLIAVTPETPDNSLTTTEKNALSFEILSDTDNTVAKKLGLVFQLPENLQGIYDKFGIDVQKHNGNADFELPMPATFVLDTNGKIVYKFVSEDYTKRADIEAILAAL